MREARYWDFLESIHYILIVLFVALLIFQIRILAQSLKNKKIATSVTTCVGVFCTLFIGLITHTIAFPGGGLNDSVSRMDKSTALIVQAKLETYKGEEGAYPTTDQGLNVLYPKIKPSSCSTSNSIFPEFKYTSDGKIYKIESSREYGTKGIVIVGTNEQRAQFYIRE